MKTLIPYLLYVNKIRKKNRSEIGMSFCHSWNFWLSIYILILRFKLIRHSKSWYIFCQEFMSQLKTTNSFPKHFHHITCTYQVLTGVLLTQFRQFFCLRLASASWENFGPLFEKNGKKSKFFSFSSLKNFLEIHPPVIDYL